MLRRMQEVLVDYLKEKLRLEADYTNVVRTFHLVVPSLVVESLALMVVPLHLVAFVSLLYLSQV